LGPSVAQGVAIQAVGDRAAGDVPIRDHANQPVVFTDGQASNSFVAHLSCDFSDRRVRTCQCAVMRSFTSVAVFGRA
jgi:hypothetical protein